MDVGTLSVHIIVGSSKDGIEQPVSRKDAAWKGLPTHTKFSGLINPKKESPLKLARYPRLLAAHSVGYPASINEGTVPMLRDLIN